MYHERDMPWAGFLDRPDEASGGRRAPAKPEVAADLESVCPALDSSSHNNTQVFKLRAMKAEREQQVKPNSESESAKRVLTRQSDTRATDERADSTESTQTSTATPELEGRLAGAISEIVLLSSPDMVQ